MNHKTSPLNGDFGVMIEGVSRADISDPAFQRQAFDLWTEHGGLLAVRGDDLADTISSPVRTRWCRASRSCASAISATRPAS
jgi:hypothetical protein